jgi:PAS domain S-box-containing protein
MLKLSNLKLVYKGLILVAVPLLFELAFVAIFLLLKHQAESEVAAAEKSKLIIASAHAIPAAGVSTLNRLLLYGMRRTEEARQAYYDYRGTVPQKERALFELIKDNPLQRENFQAAVKSQEKVLAYFDSGARTIDEHGLQAVLMLNSISEKTAEMLYEGTAAWAKVVEEEEKKTHLRAATESRAVVDYWLYGGVLLNVLLAVALVHFFSREIARKIAVLVENSKRLVTKEPLSTIIAGSDEISQLDSSFHQLAEELAEAESKERTMVDNAADVICSLDSSGRIIRINPIVKMNWGYGVNELIGRRLLELVSKEDSVNFEQATDRLKSDQTDTTLELRLYRQDQSLIDILLSMHWSAPDQTFICVCHDVTRRKELERMKRQFVATVTHDLRSPLTGILFTTGLLVEGAYGEITERAGKEIAAVEDAVTQMLDLINNLLFVEKLESGKMQIKFKNVSLLRLLGKVTALLSSTLERQAVQLTVPETDLEACVDEEKLSRVFVNLVLNAARVSAPRSEIRIAIEQKEGMVEASVFDQGPALPDSFGSVIFDRVKRLDSTLSDLPRSTRLGLVLCREIVELHGGRIGVESLQSGPGSRFWFTVPGKS